MITATVSITIVSVIVGNVMHKAMAFIVMVTGSAAPRALTRAVSSPGLVVKTCAAATMVTRVM